MCGNGQIDLPVSFPGNSNKNNFLSFPIIIPWTFWLPCSWSACRVPVSFLWWFLRQVLITLRSLFVSSEFTVKELRGESERRPLCTRFNVHALRGGLTSSHLRLLAGAVIRRPPSCLSDIHSVTVTLGYGALVMRTGLPEADRSGDPDPEPSQEHPGRRVFWVYRF